MVEVEQAFKESKNDLSIRAIYHQLETRIEAHIFIAFLAYCLFVTLKLRLKTLAPGLTPRAVLEELAAMQMIDVELPTTDDRVVVLSRLLNRRQKSKRGTIAPGLCVCRRVPETVRCRVRQSGNATNSETTLRDVGSYRPAPEPRGCVPRRRLRHEGRNLSSLPAEGYSSGPKSAYPISEGSFSCAAARRKPCVSNTAPIAPFKRSAGLTTDVL